MSVAVFHDDLPLGVHSKYFLQLQLCILHLPQLVSSIDANFLICQSKTRCLFVLSTAYSSA